jgi:magnesium transporter
MADADTLTFAFMRGHPAEAAHILDLAPTVDVVNLFIRVPTRVGGAVLADMDARVAAYALLAMNEERALELLSELGSQSAVAILRQIEEPARSRLIAGLPTVVALTAKLLVQFTDDSVGACVDTNVIAVLPSSTVRDAVDRVRLADIPADRVFAVDGQRHLLGWVPLDALIRAPAELRLEALMNQATSRLSVNAPLTGVRADPGWQSASVLPVVDRDNRLVGLLTRELLERALQRANTAANHSPATSESLPVMLVHGYWQTISGILEALTASLPAVHAPEVEPHEH